MKNIKIQYRDNEGNLRYKCWSCKRDYNFKAMRYISESMYCPDCDKKVKL